MLAEQVEFIVLFSVGSPAVKQRLNSVSEPHSIKPISSVKSERSDAPPPSASAAVPKPGPAKIQPDTSLRIAFTSEEIDAALRPAFQQVWDQDPEAYPFRQPVDPQALGIPVSPFMQNSYVDNASLVALVLANNGCCLSCSHYWIVVY